MGYVFWCAACGNPDIIVESDKQGYSMKKGLAGAVILGPVGAVAGLDGKETTSYYCPKCGARLKSPMPDYEVNTILQLLEDPENSRSRIEEKLKKYPNMMLPKGWDSKVYTGATETQKTANIQRTPGKLDYNEFKNILESSSEAMVESRMYDYLRQFDSVTYKDMDDFGADMFNYPGLGELWNGAIHDLLRSYKLRKETIHGCCVYEVAKDEDEIKAWRWEANADKVPLDNYLEFVQELIKIKPRSVNEIEQELINKEPAINNDNPYTALSVAKRACKYLDQKSGRVDFNGEQIMYKSTKLAEDDLRWNVEEDWKRSHTIQNYVSTVRTIFPILKSKSRLTITAFSQSTSTLTPQRIAATLKQLCDTGYCTKEVISNKVYYSLNSEYTDWDINEFVKLQKASAISRKLGEGKEVIVLDILKKNSGKSFWEMMDDKLSDNKETKKYYELFMLLELEEYACRKENANEYIWEYLDKDAAAREKLNAEKNQLEKDIADCEKEQEEQVKKINELKEELKNKSFDESEYTSKISDLEGTLSSLESKLSSLGLFSFREKKETNERIATCKNDIEKTRRSLSDAKRNFSSDISKKNASYDAEINKYKNDLSAKKKRLSEINEKLKKMN